MAPPRGSAKKVFLPDFAFFGCGEQYGMKRNPSVKQFLMGLCRFFLIGGFETRNQATDGETIERSFR
jgi:hypothetical protein